ncbi:MAG: hypothetical protein NVSMB66_5140 [Candidatus Doudnabacteria bacterium]
MKRLTFKDRVKNIVSRIPKGKTLTYGEVAELAGSPGAFRAVGSIMSQNYDPAIPCHRVVRANGKVGNYNRGGVDKKTKMLRDEGALEGFDRK